MNNEAPDYCSIDQIERDITAREPLLIQRDQSNIVQFTQEDVELHRTIPTSYVEHTV